MKNFIKILSILIIFLIFSCSMCLKKMSNKPMKLTVKIKPEKEVFFKNDPEKITVVLSLKNISNEDYYFYSSILSSLNLEIKKRVFLCFYKDVSNRIKTLSLDKGNFGGIFSITKEELFEKDETVSDSISQLINEVKIKEHDVIDIKGLREFYKVMLDNVFYLHSGESIYNEINISYLYAKKGKYRIKYIYPNKNQFSNIFYIEKKLKKYNIPLPVDKGFKKWFESINSDVYNIEIR